MKQDYTIKDATHYLKCAHQIGNNRTEYDMNCLILKDMGNGRVKILVFGDHYWINTDDVKKIRYVSRDRIKANK